MRDIIIFGKGAYYVYKKNIINKKYNVIAFLDNNTISGDVFDGINVYNPNEINQLPYVDILIMTSKKFILTMLDQLIEMNVSLSRVKVGLLEEPAFDAVEKVLQSTDTIVDVSEDGLKVKYLNDIYEIDDLDSFHSMAKKIMDKNDAWIEKLKELPIEPLSKSFGTERGTAIDRYYIEKFLKENNARIRGTVVEVAEDTYTQKFGVDVIDSYILHVENWGDVGKNHIKVNLATGEGVKENIADCIIITQTIQMIYELGSVIKNLKKMLKPGGTVLATAHCIGQISMNDYRNWGEYWRFTDLAFERLFKEEFEDVKVKAYGNMKALICFMYGLSLEDMKEEELDYYDEQYPMIITAIARKE